MIVSSFTCILEHAFYTSLMRVEKGTSAAQVEADGPVEVVHSVNFIQLRLSAPLLLRRYSKSYCTVIEQAAKLAGIFAFLFARMLRTSVEDSERGRVEVLSHDDF